MVSFCCQVLTKPLKDYAAKARSSNAYELSFAFICFELIVGRILPETPQCFPSQSILVPPPTYTYLILQYSQNTNPSSAMW